jgi:predicted GTPase
LALVFKTLDFFEIMSIQLNKPSKSIIRSQFCLEKLRDSSFISSVNIFFTGRTGSGKTTFINLLVNENYFPSTGFQDCTDEVNVLELPIGLKSFDVPGVCSDDQLENYNRAALGIKQLADLNHVENLTIAKYNRDSSSIKCDYRAIEFCEILKPDLIFYLIAPDKQFLRSDREYLTHLLKHYHQVIYVFNMFADEQGKQNFATRQNIDDAMKKMTEVHKSVLGENKEPKILQINCRTGEGIDNLFMESREMLGFENEKGKIFQVLIDYQSIKTPDTYADQVKQEILRLCAYAACKKPIQNDTPNLWEVCEQLWIFLTDILEKPQPMPKPIKKAVKELVKKVIDECVEKHYEDEIKEVTKPIYKRVPVLSTFYDYEYDYDQPIYEVRRSYHEPGFLKGIDNLLSHGRWETEYTYREIIGYEQRLVRRQEWNGEYRDEYDRDEKVREKTGKKILKGETYHYFKEKAIILILVFAHLVASTKIFQYKNKDEVLAESSKLSVNIKDKVSKLLSFSDEPEQEQVLSLLERHIGSLFEPSFDVTIKKIIS